MTGVGNGGEPGLEGIRVGVFRLFAYCLFTLFVYYPVWFLKVGPSLNRLNSNKKIDVGLPVFCVTYAVLNLLVGFGYGWVTASGAEGDLARLAASAAKASDILGIAAAVVLLILTFRVRRILTDHFGNRAALSGAATLILGIFYLQDRINRLAGAAP